MAVPFKIVGCGNNSVALNVIGLSYSELLSSVPQLRAWDDLTLATAVNQIFVGTTGNTSLPMIAAIATSTDSDQEDTPVSDWKPAAATGGGLQVNRLVGSTSYVLLNPDIPVSEGLPGTGATGPFDGGVSKFNMVYEIPYDAPVPSTVAGGGVAPAVLDHVLTVRVTYTGATPTIIWYGNDSGTDIAPVWTVIASGVTPNFVNGADADADPGVTPYKLTRPDSSVVDAGAYIVSAA